jgi:cytochrome c
MCHIKTRPQDMSSLVAPLLMGVMRHVKMQYPNKEDAIAFMVDYVQYPSKDKSVCMPQKIQRFGLMPSQKGNISVKELQAVTSWMYDNFPPKNFRGRGMMEPIK